MCGRVMQYRLGRFLLAAFTLIWCIACAGGGQRRPAAFSKSRPQKTYHVVRRGETLWRIASAYGVKLDDLIRINGLRDPDRIEVGQRLLLPNRLSSHPKLNLAKRQKRLKVSDNKYYKPGFNWPLTGKIAANSGYAEGVKNEGIDILAPSGSEIRAADEGWVVYANNKMRYYGNMLIIRHKYSFFTVYAHNKTHLVKTNQWVNRGQVIALVGRTGHITTPRLHFEIRKGERAVNPLTYLPQLTR